MSCFVPGCVSGYPKTRMFNKIIGVKNVSVFKPKDEEERMIWNKLILRADRTLKMSNYVCELHFQPECVDKTYSTVLSDGSLFTMDRGIPLLKSGSVPTIFPNLPKYLSHTIKKRKSPKKRSLSAQKRQKPNQFEPNRTSQNNFENVTIAREPFSTNETPLISFTFDDLKNGLKCLNLPNSSWAYCCTNSNILFSRWREIKNDIIAAVGIKLNLKIIINNTDRCLPELELPEVSSSKNLELILHKINEIPNVCEGVCIAR